MTNQFAKLIKTLQREVTEEKTVRRRSSLTLQTITKTVTLSCTVHRTSTNYFLTKAGLARITFNTSTPQIFASITRSTGGRGISFSNLNLDNGAGVIAIPTIGNTWDSGMSVNSDKTFTVQIGITATADFTVTADQVNYEEIL